MESWAFREENGKIVLVMDGKSSKEVVGMKYAADGRKIKLKLVNDEVAKVDLKNFEGRIKSRSSFLKHWREKVDQNKENQSLQDSSADSISHSTEVTVNDIHDASLEKKFCGIVNVHITNLVSPDPTRATRSIDFNHVGSLTQSLTDNKCGQLVIFVGLMKEPCNIEKLEEEDSSVKVEVLGGNHTREAMQALHKEEPLDRPLVKVHLYRGLTRLEALMLGYQHNIITHEKKKPMTFFDKVRLMRNCRNDLSTPAWKDMLVALFRLKDRRKLQQSYQHHLLMACLPDELFKLIVEASQGLSISDKFFKQLMRLPNQNDMRECLLALKMNGVKAFKSKVAEFVSVGRVRSKKTTQQTTEEGSEELQTSEELVELSSLDPSDSADCNDDLWKEKYDKLLEKYNALAKENDNLLKMIENGNELEIDGFQPQFSSTPEPPQQVANSDTVFKIDFEKGDEVQAFWREEDGKEEWLDAKIIQVYANGAYKVQYMCDKAYCKLRPSWVKQRPATN